MQNKYWLPINEGYDKDGHARELGSVFTTSLDNRIISDLSQLETATGMEPGSATLGTTDIDLTMHYYDVILNYQYGVTDRLTIGAEIPYYWQWTDVNRATVNTDSATVGINFDSQGPPLLPLASGGVADGDMVMELVQAQLENMGYKRIENWSDKGFGDIKAGIRYQYLDKSPWRLAITTGITIPTGEVDNIDNLVDIEFGEGAWGGFIHFNNDYSGFEKLTLNATFRYEHYLPFSQSRRIPESPGSFLASSTQSVDVQLGDKVELEFAGNYLLTEAISLEAQYRYAYRFEESLEGSADYDYGFLEEDSYQEEQVVIIGFCISPLPPFQKNEIPLPFTVTLDYRNRFAGKNVLATSYIRLLLALFF